MSRFRRGRRDDDDRDDAEGDGRDEGGVDRPENLGGEKRDRRSARARRRLADRVGDGSAGSSRGGGRDRPKPLNRPKPQAGGDASDGSDDRAERAGPGDKSRRRAAKAGDDEAGADEGGKRRRSAARAGRDRDSSRQRRARSGRRAGTAAAGFAAALKRGGAETGRRVATAAPRAGRVVLAALATVFALFFAVLGALLAVLIAAGRVVAGPLGAILRALDRAARAASRLLTPVRALTLVVAGAAILLALSQYADYRSIAIGNDAYSGVQTVAPAPETGRLEAGDPHSYVFVPIAIACLVLLAIAVATSRWRLLRLITLAGVAAVVVAVVVDRPAGLDPGTAAVSFEDVRATLIGGFYAQIAAGVLLIGSSALLARELRLAGARQAAPRPGRGARSRTLVGARRTPGPGDARA